MIILFKKLQVQICTYFCAVLCSLSISPHQILCYTWDKVFLPHKY